MSKFLDQNGALYLWQKIVTRLGLKVDKVEGKGLSKNDYTDEDKTKLSGIAAGANNYEHPTINLITQDTPYTAVHNYRSDTGSHVYSINAHGVGTDATGHVNTIINKTQQIVMDLVDADESGLMSVADKAKLDGVEAGANNYEHPTYSLNQSPAPSEELDYTINELTGEQTYFFPKYSIGTNNGHLTTFREIEQRLKIKFATAFLPGLMSTVDKTKLDGIAENANNYTHPTSAGNKHIPSGGSSGQILRWSAAGTATWGADDNTTYSPATSSVNGLMSSADKVKLDAFGAASTYALKSDITGMYKYLGSKIAVSALPETGNTVGDVWNVTASGMNYAWDGTAWDALGEIFTINAITNAEIDAITAS